MVSAAGCGGRLERADLAFVKMLVEEYDVDVNEKSGSALAAAASKGHLEVVLWLLEHGATMSVERNGEMDCAALRAAATQGHLDVVKLLVERGANIHWIEDEMNAMSLANFYARTDVAKYLQSVGAKHMTELRPRDFETGYRMVLEAHVEHRGALGAWQRKVPGDPVVTIHTIPAGEQFNCRTLCTVGLCDKNLPPSMHLFSFQELRMTLAADWRFDDPSLAEPRWNWPVVWFERIIEELRSGKSRPDHPVLFMNGDPPQPLFGDTELCGWICLHSYEGVDLPDCREPVFWDLYAITATEAQYARENSYESLMERFEERDTPMWVDPNRNCAITGG